MNSIYDRGVYLRWYKAAFTKLVACGNATLVLNIFICRSFLTLFHLLLPLL